jgi:prephenate dehydrogenase
MNAKPQHVIFGTGAIGLATLDALRRRGEPGVGVGREGSEATTIEEVAATPNGPGTFFRYFLAKE